VGRDSVEPVLKSQVFRFKALKLGPWDLGLPKGS
jgi:hypothetical protein